MRPQRSSRTTAVKLVALGVLTLLLLTACAGVAGPNNVAGVSTGHISGFWSGLWQGIIMPITFIVSLFNHNVGIYDVHNNGNWYNFGFVLGAFVISGGAFRGSCSARRR